jgi:hypothetical protein
VTVLTAIWELVSTALRYVTFVHIVYVNFVSRNESEWWQEVLGCSSCSPVDGLEISKANST